MSSQLEADLARPPKDIRLIADLLLLEQYAMVPRHLCRMNLTVPNLSWMLKMLLHSIGTGMQGMSLDILLVTSLIILSAARTVRGQISSVRLHCQRRRIASG